MASRLPAKSIPPADPERTDELQKTVREDIEEQRKLLEKLRRKMN
ncbi:hypothetical protein [Bradyrhizobium guangdongense]|uniref:Uncharacterized protein n=1 Tax=Bradyrhizobium guangdongense TaxID=1325090 RepID=A0AA87WGZ4_9BRAD|nr:hypothetical protein [Bradyrhizobium guangdongense]GGI34291.1 hypothetical protein GCM10010987_78660 [Bradyrhizobium guangdongense]